MMSLFADIPDVLEPLPGVKIFRQYWDHTAQLTALAECRQLIKQAPFFQPKMRSGQTFTQKLTNCGKFGWVADEQGYRYQRHHPVTRQPWPEIPDFILQSAQDIARQLNADDFLAESCLMNFYPRETGKLGMHQDRTEQNRTAPIITFSLGDSAIFRVASTVSQTGGVNLQLDSGDVAVLYGVGRMRYHGITKLIARDPSLFTSPGRISLTLRRVESAVPPAL